MSCIWFRCLWTFSTKTRTFYPNAGSTIWCSSTWWLDSVSGTIRVDIHTRSNFIIDDPLTFRLADCNLTLSNCCISWTLILKTLTSYSSRFNCALTKICITSTMSSKSCGCISTWSILTSGCLGVPLTKNIGFCALNLNYNTWTSSCLGYASSSIGLNCTSG